MTRFPLKGHVLVAITKDGTPSVYFDIAFEARGKDLVLDMQAGCEIPGREVPLNWSELRIADARLNAFLMVNDIGQEPQQEKHASADPGSQACQGPVEGPW